LGHKRRLDRLCRERKRGLERITDILVNVPPLLDDRRAQDRIVTRKRHAHLARLSLPQGRTALDVGEEEGDRARWEVSP
jgi:hypothetical protein